MAGLALRPRCPGCLPSCQGDLIPRDNQIVRYGCTRGTDPPYIRGGGGEDLPARSALSWGNERSALGSVGSKRMGPTAEPPNAAQTIAMDSPPPPSRAHGVQELAGVLPPAPPLLPAHPRWSWNSGATTVSLAAALEKKDPLHGTAQGLFNDKGLCTRADVHMRYGGGRSWAGKPSFLLLCCGHPAPLRHALRPCHSLVSTLRSTTAIPFTHFGGSQWCVAAGTCTPLPPTYTKEQTGNVQVAKRQFLGNWDLLQLNLSLKFKVSSRATARVKE